jgi:hypothetical protein
VNLPLNKTSLDFIVGAAQKYVFSFAALAADHCHVNIVAMSGPNVSNWYPIALAACGRAFSFYKFSFH